MNRNHFTETHAAYDHKAGEDGYCDKKHNQINPDIESLHQEFWDDQPSVHEAIQETAWDQNVFDLLNAIRDPRTSVKDAQKLYTELGKLMYDDIDNYLAKQAETIIERGLIDV